MPDLRIHHMYEKRSKTQLLCVKCRTEFELFATQAGMYYMLYITSSTFPRSYCICVIFISPTETFQSCSGPWQHKGATRNMPEYTWWYHAECCTHIVPDCELPVIVVTSALHALNAAKWAVCIAQPREALVRLLYMMNNRIMVPDPRLCVCEPTHYGIREWTLTKKKKKMCYPLIPFCVSHTCSWKAVGSMQLFSNNAGSARKKNPESQCVYEML